MSARKSFSSSCKADALFERKRDGYLLSDNPELLDIDAIYEFLTHSYWALGIPRDAVARAIANSLYFGLFTDSARQQVGFARFITDAATFAYLCDVYVLPAHRRRGLGQWIVQQGLSHPKLQKLRRIVLVTRDAHAIYGRCGFRNLARPEGYMEIFHPGIYRE